MVLVENEIFGTSNRLWGVLLVTGYLVLLMKMFWLMRLNCDWWRLEQV